MEVTTHSLKTLLIGLSVSFVGALTGDDVDSIEELSMLCQADAETMEYPFLDDSLAINDEWSGSRELQRLKEHGFSITEKLPNGGFRIPVPKIETNKYEGYNKSAAALGEAARRYPSKLIGQLIKEGHTRNCYDGQYFFDTDHPVGNGVYANDMGGAGAAWYLFDLRSEIKPLVHQRRKEFGLKMMNADTDEGVFTDNEVRVGTDGAMAVGYGLWQRALKSRQTPDAANLAAAIAQMEGVRRSNGDPFGASATVLVCVPAQKKTFQDLLEATNNSAGATNTQAGVLKVISTLWVA